MKRTSLSLDLGITTGYAFHSLQGDLIEYGDLAEEGFEESLKNLVHGEHFVSYSVAERPVIIRGQLGDRLARIIASTERILTRQVVLVDPSRWKSTPHAKTSCPRGTSAHTKDAIRLGRWYLQQIGQAQ